MKKVIAFLVVSVCVSTSMLMGKHQHRQGQDYFFPPPKSLYYFRPDLYIQRHHPPFFRHPGPYYRYYYPRSPHRFPRYRPPLKRYWPGVIVHHLTMPEKTEIVRLNSSDLIFQVEPKNALIYIDDKLIGSAGDFSKDRNAYPILDGEYELRIEHPDFEPYRSTLSVTPDRTLNLELRLKRRDR
jgi:hypothetical protein